MNIMYNARFNPNEFSDVLLIAAIFFKDIEILVKQAICFGGTDTVGAPFHFDLA